MLRIKIFQEIWFSNLSITWGMIHLIRFRIWIGIKMKSRVRMPIPYTALKTIFFTLNSCRPFSILHLNCVVAPGKAASKQLQMTIRCATQRAMSPLARSSDRSALRRRRVRWPMSSGHFLALSGCWAENLTIRKSKMNFLGELYSSIFSFFDYFTFRYRFLSLF